ncbi:MAG: hypothetical protein Q4E64_03665 [Phascolarctobacterium sp.]|uniref:hypothetical protein n=1 Tax=Phascolarctobacterium sp. TaxID=2049039 RepID=UPI0026DB9903|nr:hypothetical protein [Phascolarctobacterium sp.]MDO4920910.1 hypothetical protein [Phascolarctobacterium sp.]
MEIRDILAKEIARGIIATGVEGAYDSVACSTAYSYPSIGISQWEGSRADELLGMIDGGGEFIGRSYINIKASGELPMLQAILRSEQGKAAQEQLLARDCLVYVDALRQVPTLDDTRCLIYAGIWCPTSHRVVATFLRNRYNRGCNLRSLSALRELFINEYYIAADVGEAYYAGYKNRAWRTYDYVAGIDLTTPYGIPAYGEADNGR